MNDITQSGTGENVIFSPSTTEAENWMRQHYAVSDDVTVSFEIPDEADEAKVFKSAAKDAGFEILLFP